MNVTTSKIQHKDEKSKGKSSNIQCFKCLRYRHKAAQYLNAKIMTLHNGEVVSEEEDDDDDLSDMLALEDASDV